MPDDLYARLAASPSVRSLAAEQQLVKWFMKQKWSVRHGSFYRDPITNKLRELDLVAQRNWQRTYRGQQQGVTVEVHAEAKSIRDYHLVFAPLASGRTPELAQREWLGYHDKEIAAALERGGATPEEITAAIHGFDRAAATREGRIRVHGLMVDPWPAWFQSSAFRETNVGGEKDLDASVLWRAIQTVFGAVDSARLRSVENPMSDLSDVVGFARRVRRSVPEVVAEELHGSLGYVRIYHPIVFVESTIWSLAGGKLQQREWVRFFRLGPEWPDLWCDVVQMSAAFSYLRMLTASYSLQMRRLRAHARPSR